MKTLSRRDFVNVAVGGLAVSSAALSLHGQTVGNNGRLVFRVQPATVETSSGLHPLGLRPKDDALLYIPEAAKKFDKAPLVISLHGQGREAARGIEVFRPSADEHGFLLLAPKSTSPTWDLVDHAYGPDVLFMEQCLRRTFEMRNVDPKRIAIAGFSDGGSYALSLGLKNGGLFAAVLGFSAGFLADEDRSGMPPVSLSHGIRDDIFPIEACGRQICEQLRREGYRVTYREFDGDHDLPPATAAAGMSWFMALPA